MHTRYHGSVTRWSSLKDATKLCFASAACFAACGTAGLLMNYFAADTTQLGALLWIGGFYVVLGLVEQWRPASAAAGEFQSPIADSGTGAAPLLARPRKTAA